MKKVFFSMVALFVAAFMLLASCSGDGGDGGSSGTDGIGGGSGASGNGNPTNSVITNPTIKIVKSDGWFNSAYIIFEQLDGATS